jgi:hypothetical protein
VRLQFVVCKVLQREAYYCAARSRNMIDVVLMPQGLHNEPDRLRSKVQEALSRIEDIQGRPYDATLLGYGLCSNGVVGLEPAIKTVIPRAHDCITLLLGSKERYQEYFDSHRGVYWYSSGWIENTLQPGQERYRRIWDQYVEKYGRENADYLMEMEQKWMKEYSWATYVDWGLPNAEEDKAFTRASAEFLRWSYDELSGDPGLIQRLVDGDWRADEALVVDPGQRIQADVTRPTIIKAS